MSGIEARSGPRLAIIGAGPGGLCMAIRLKQAGFEDFVVLEKADGLGGTWFHNRYPGCAVDLPSFLYSFSFEPNPDWSRPYAPQGELLAYLEHCADKYRVRAHCRFGNGVMRADWDESDASWTLTLEDGAPIRADVVVSAVGMFNALSWPAIEGRDSFEGVSFHSAQWDHAHELAGRDVAVIGSAASAVQIVPEIVKEAAQVHLFQRSANWVMPKDDVPFSEEQLALFRADPDVLAAIRQECYDRIDAGMTFQIPEQLREMEASVSAALEVVEDPAVREKLKPRHPFGCKRPLLSNDYFPAFNRPNLELVTEPIARITKSAIVTTDGAERPVDTIIFATGFAATRYVSTIDVRGRGGQRIEEAWKDGATAYLGITTAGFPNLFMLYGPNTNNGSILEMIECQVDHVLLQLQRMERESLVWIDVLPGAMADYNDEVQVAMDGIEVWQAGCNGYYRTPSGRIVTQWPFSMSEFRTRTAEIHPEAFESVPKRSNTA